MDTYVRFLSHELDRRAARGSSAPCAGRLFLDFFSLLVAVRFCASWTLLLRISCIMCVMDICQYSERFSFFVLRVRIASAGICLRVRIFCSIAQVQNDIRSEFSTKERLLAGVRSDPPPTWVSPTPRHDRRQIFQYQPRTKSNAVTVTSDLAVAVGAHIQCETDACRLVTARLSRYPRRYAARDRGCRR